MEQRSGYYSNGDGPSTGRAADAISLNGLQDLAKMVETVIAVRKAQQTVNTLSADQRRSAALSALSPKADSNTTLVAAIIMHDDPRLFEDIRHAYSDQKAQIQYPDEKRLQYVNDADIVRFNYKVAAIRDFDRVFSKTNLATPVTEPAVSRDAPQPVKSTTLDNSEIRNATGRPPIIEPASGKREAKDDRGRPPVPPKGEPKSNGSPAVYSAKPPKPFSYTQPNFGADAVNRGRPTSPKPTTEPSPTANVQTNSPKFGNPATNAPKFGQPTVYALKFGQPVVNAPKSTDPPKPRVGEAIAQQSAPFGLAVQFEGAKPTKTPTVPAQKPHGFVKH